MLLLPVMRTSSFGFAVALGIGLVAAVALLDPRAPGLRVQSAEASVSIAASLENLVEGAHVVALAEPEESRTEWEGGRIVTFTKLKVVEKISGESPDTVWVKTLGGMVDHIGQSVEGEPVFVKGTRSMLFLRRSTDKIVPDLHMVVARAQGQYPLALDKARWFVRAHGRAGLIVPSKEKANAPMVVLPKTAAMARLKDRPVDDVVNEVRTLWTQLHAKKSQ